MESYHITVSGVPLCRVRGLRRRDIGCNYIIHSRAKSSILRLIEMNPEHDIRSYSIVPGNCPTMTSEAMAKIGPWINGSK